MNKYLLMEKIIKDPELNPELKEKFSQTQIKKAKKENIKSPWLDNFILSSISPAVDETVNTLDKTKNYLKGQ